MRTLKLGIIQPGKIGDIIICLPIAKWFHDLGYDVIWPIDRNIINNFVDYVDYVTFIPIDFDCRVAHEVCFNQMCAKIVDVSFTIPGASSLNSERYLNQTKYSFDQFKYHMANVPFEQKWKLHINRNSEREQELFEKLECGNMYAVCQEHSSDNHRPVHIESPNLKRIDVTPITKSVFDWIGVLEKAKLHVLIESCMTNLVDQLGIKGPEQYMLMKKGYYGTNLVDGRPRGLPVLKSEWKQL